MNLVPMSPAHAPAKAARAAIENVAATLRESGARFDRRGVSERLTRAVRSLYAVMDTSVEAPAHHDGLGECGRVLAEARSLIARVEGDAPTQKALAALDATIANVARAADEIIGLMLARRADPRASVAAEAPVRPFQASVGIPRLHAIARAPIADEVDVEPTVSVRVPKPRRAPPKKPATLEELRAAAATPAEPVKDAAEEPPAPAPRAPSPDEGETLRRVARDCLEDIASLRALRKPIPTETWLDQAPFEQRLLDNIDAFVSLGHAALPSLSLFHAEAPAPDPARGFAVALTLGCIEGTDTVDLAVATMTHSAPIALAGFAEGFVLAPSPAIDAELAPLLDAPSPDLCGVAIDVLGARGALPIDAAERVLARRDARLTLRLACVLARALPKTKACAVLANILDDGADDDLFGAACASLMCRGDAAVRTRLRDAIRARASKTRVARATALLAIGGSRDDASLLLDGIAYAPTVEGAAALGRHGNPAVIPALLALLGLEDEAIVASAASALDFMTNAGLRETKEVPWTPGTDAPTRRVSTVVADRAAWEAWAARARATLAHGVKLRGGVPFLPSMIVDELLGLTPPARRAEAAFELVVATGVGARLATTDWVGRQKQSLGEIREHVRTLGATPGAFWYAGAGV